MSTAAPVWVTRPQDSNLEEGKPGYLHCNAQANPQPEVVWYRNNIMISSEVCSALSLVLTVAASSDDVFIFVSLLQDSRFKTFPNGTLRINNVEVYDSHMYSCESKTVGGRLSGHARVTVLGELRGGISLLTTN